MIDEREGVFRSRLDERLVRDRFSSTDQKSEVLVPDRRNRL